MVIIGRGMRVGTGVLFGYGVRVFVGRVCVRVGKEVEVGRVGVRLGVRGV